MSFLSSAQAANTTTPLMPCTPPPLVLFAGTAPRAFAAWKDGRNTSEMEIKWVVPQEMCAQFYLCPILSDAAAAASRQASGRA